MWRPGREEDVPTSQTQSDYVLLAGCYRSCQFLSYKLQWLGHRSGQAEDKNSRRFWFWHTGRASLTPLVAWTCSYWRCILIFIRIGCTHLRCLDGQCHFFFIV